MYWFYDAAMLCDHFFNTEDLIFQFLNGCRSPSFPKLSKTTDQLLKTQKHIEKHKKKTSKNLEKTSKNLEKHRTNIEKKRPQKFQNDSSGPSSDSPRRPGRSPGRVRRPSKHIPQGRWWPMAARGRLKWGGFVLFFLVLTCCFCCFFKCFFGFKVVFGASKKKNPCRAARASKTRLPSCQGLVAAAKKRKHRDCHPSKSVCRWV